MPLEEVQNSAHALFHRSVEVALVGTVVFAEIPSYDASVAGCASYDVRFHRREPVAIVGAEKYDPWGVYHGVTVISLLWVPFVQMVELLCGGGRQTAVNC